jgi:hypothetical protein
VESRDRVEDGSSRTSPGGELLADARPDREPGAEDGGPQWPGAGARDPLARPRNLVSTAKWGTRFALVTASRPTNRARMLPAFLIAGASRCGTTTMFDALSQHPAICNPLLPWTREVHYFDNGYDRGLAWYQSHFPLKMRARRAASAIGAEPLAFESGPYYMFHPLAPERIHRDLPGVRLLVLLRDPVERAFSAHANSVSVHCETESFERALELEDSRLAGEAERIVADPTYPSFSHRHHSYRIRGQYAEQLERLEGLFGRDRIHVVDSGDFFASPVPVYNGVLEFLGLPPLDHPVVRRLNSRPRPAPMPAAVRIALEDHYRPHNERLAKWLGREPSWCR